MDKELGSSSLTDRVQETELTTCFTEVEKAAEEVARVAIPDSAEKRVVVLIYGSTALGSSGRGLDLLLVTSSAETAWDIINNTCVVKGRATATWTYNRRFLEFVMARRGYAFMHVSPHCWALTGDNVHKTFSGSKSMIFTAETLKHALDPGNPHYVFVAARLRSRLLLLRSSGSEEMVVEVNRSVRDARLTASIIALAYLASRTDEARAISLREFLEEVLDFGYRADLVRRPMGEADKAARIMQEWGHRNPRGFALRGLAREYETVIAQVKTALADSSSDAHDDETILRIKALMGYLAMQSIEVCEEGYVVELADRATTAQKLELIHRSMVINILRAEFWNVMQGADWKSVKTYLRAKKRGKTS